MSSQFLTIVTCLAMLWHSIGGCCWHHDHEACDAGTAISSTGTMHHAPGQRSHFHHDHKLHTSHRTKDEVPSPASPHPHGRHCCEVTCVYLKSFSPDVTGLIHVQSEFVSPAIELLSAQSAPDRPESDRVLLHRETLSARNHCALTQSWLL